MTGYDQMADDETKLAILEVNMSHLAQRVEEIAETQKGIQQLILQESRNRHDIETLQRDKSEIKQEMDEIKDELKEFRKDVYSTLKTISDSVSNNSFVSKAVLGTVCTGVGAVAAAVINNWLSK